MIFTLYIYDFPKPEEVWYLNSTGKNPKTQSVTLCLSVSRELTIERLLPNNDPGNLAILRQGKALLLTIKKKIVVRTMSITTIYKIIFGFGEI